MIEDGKDGQPACTLTLSQDHISVGVGPNVGASTVTTVNAPITVAAYEGGSSQTFTFTTSVPSSGTGFKVYYQYNNVGVSVSGTTLTVTSLTGEQGTITFVLYKGTAVVDTQVCTIAGNKEGAPGTTYELILNNGDTLVETASGIPATALGAQAMSRQGSGEYQAVNVYWKLGNTNLNGSNATSSIYVKNNNGTWAWSATSSSYTNTSISVAAGTIILAAYTDSSRTKLFDQETINVIPRGAQGSTGTQGKGSRIQTCYYRTSTWGTSASTSNSVQWALNHKPDSIVSSTAANNTWTTNTSYGSPTSTYLYVVTCTQTIEISSNNAETLTSTSTPVLGLAYSSLASVSPQQMASYYTVTAGNTNDAFDFSTGKLLIKATYINSLGITAKDIEVKDSNDRIYFKADSSGPTVNICGFKLDYNSMWYATDTTWDKSQFYICSTGTSSSWTVGNSGSTPGWVLFVRPASAVSGTAHTGGVFGVKNDGSMYATAGDIAGWTLSKTSLTNGSIGSNNSICLYTANQSSSTSIGGYSYNDWRLTIGSKFGVDSYGNVVATNIHAQGGDIANWNISTNYLSAGTVFLYSANNVTAQSLSNCPFKVLNDGSLYCSAINASHSTSQISFQISPSRPLSDALEDGTAYTNITSWITSDFSSLDLDSINNNQFSRDNAFLLTPAGLMYRAKTFDTTSGYYDGAMLSQSGLVLGGTNNNYYGFNRTTLSPSGLYFQSVGKNRPLNVAAAIYSGYSRKRQWTFKK